MARGHRDLCFCALAIVCAALAACGGRGLTPPAAPAVTSPWLAGVPALPAGDRGRRNARDPVTTAIVLRFNHEQQLMRFVAEVSDPHSPSYRRFLTQPAFVARFAPTPVHYRRVLRVLQANGFTIAQTWPDRLMILAQAPSAVAERFFRTRIHDFDQGPDGIHYANVHPLRIPPAIAPLIAAIELNSLVYARALPATRPAAIEPSQAHALVNAIANGGFEKGLKHWKSCNIVTLSTLHPFAGRYSALVGSKTTSSGNVRGMQALCQRVLVPRDAVLTARTYGVTNIASVKSGYQEIGLMSSPGTIVRVLRKSIVNDPKWALGRWRLGTYAGQTLYVYFAVRGHGQKKLYDQLFVDDVSLIGHPVPSPSPSVSPSASPSSSPTPSPSASPVGPGSDPGTPLRGPTLAPDGAWEPRGVADGLDLAVQHGYGGSGVRVALVMQNPVKNSDLAKFLSENGITRSTTIKEVPIGAGAGSGDATQGMLELETLAALLPDADITAYETPNLSNVYVMSAYRNALNATSPPSVFESAFGLGICDSDDPGFDTTVENDAIEAAATGMTFVAASGDEGVACYSASQNKSVVGTVIPASAPYVVAIGGNESVPTGGITSPVVWNGDNGFFVGASGGGIPTAWPTNTPWPLPSYQAGVSGSPASTTLRNVPDLALPAVQANTTVAGSDTILGGTTWSSAIAAALFAQSVEICGNLGFVNPALYTLYANTNTRGDFTDVTRGNNHFASFTGYAAARGYDNASGLGIPVGFTVAANLCGRTPASLRR